MKKSNKILMATVAILLCLVLLSTSIVSGIFARFVIEKGTSVPITFKNLGVTLHVKGTTSFTTETNGKSAVITFQGYNINPNTICDDAILFAFEENQRFVPIEVTVAVNVTTHSDFLIDATKFASISSNTAYMPLNFKVGTVADKNASAYANVNSTEAWQSASTTASLDTTLEGLIAAKIKTAMNTTTNIGTYSNGEGSYVTKSFNATTPISFTSSAKGIGFGFEWAMGDTSDTSAAAALHNAIETHLVDKFDTNEIPITITFTVTVEQTGPNN